MIFNFARLYKFTFYEETVDWGSETERERYNETGGESSPGNAARNIPQVTFEIVYFCKRIICSKQHFFRRLIKSLFQTHYKSCSRR